MYATNERIGDTPGIQLFVPSNHIPKAKQLLELFDDNFDDDHGTKIEQNSPNKDYGEKDIKIGRGKKAIILPASLLVVLFILVALGEIRTNIGISLLMISICLVIIFGVKGFLNPKKHSWDIRLSAALLGGLSIWFLVVTLGGYWKTDLGAIAMAIICFLGIGIPMFLYAFWPKKQKR